MIKFIIKRLVALIPVLLGVTLLVFFILDLAPGDPAKTILGEQARPEDIAALREEMGLNDPFIVRYGRYMFDLVQGDLGTSYKTRDPVGMGPSSQYHYAGADLHGSCHSPCSASGHYCRHQAKYAV